MMRQYARLITIAVVVGLYAACSPVLFEKESDCGPGCVRVESGKKQLEYTVTVTGGKVDILFVDDNSGSMSFEQQHMANRFSNFISSLDAQGLDYRIGITTTDVASSSNTPRAINKNGALQNGKLIPFATGVSYLTPSTPDKVNLFASSIKRAETLQCESALSSGASIFENCPSADERGIYAANLTVETNPSGFIRPDSHLAVVFLSDEDVRSQIYSVSAAYKLSSRDLPQTLIETVKSRFAGKSLSMHAIIVQPGQLKAGYSAADVAVEVAQVIGSDGQVNANKKPERFFSGGDTACLVAQGQQINNVSGSFGYLYYLGAKMTGGVVGNICSNDYSAQLRDIGENIGGKTQRIELGCSDPEVLELRYVGENGTPPGQFKDSAFVFGDSIVPGKTIYIKVQCPDS